MKTQFEQDQECKKQRFQEIESAKKIFQDFIKEIAISFWLERGYDCDKSGTPIRVVYSWQIIENYEIWIRQKVSEKINQTKELWPFQGTEIKLQWNRIKHSIEFVWRFPVAIQETLPIVWMEEK
jgi:hypothetical protein